MLYQPVQRIDKLLRWNLMSVSKPKRLKVLDEFEDEDSDGGVLIIRYSISIFI